MQFYQKGVYDSLNCSRLKVNHAMLVVGYDNSTYSDYWIVKNRYESKSIKFSTHTIFFYFPFQLGWVLGDEWLHLHGKGHVQPVWDCNRCLIPYPETSKQQ